MDELKTFRNKLEAKLLAIKNRVSNHYFIPYNIKFRSFSRGLEELIKKHMHKIEEQRLKSSTLTYEPRDAEIYYGVSIAEQYL